MQEDFTGVTCSLLCSQRSDFLFPQPCVADILSGPALPVQHHAVAGDTPRSDSEGSGVSVSLSSKALREPRGSEGGRDCCPPSLSCRLAGSGAAGARLFAGGNRADLGRDT